MAVVGNGKEIAIEYRITLPDGTEVESNVGDIELTYVHGRHEIFKAIEDALEGLAVGESTQVVLGPKDAYGAIDEKSFQLVDLDLVPDELRYRGADLAIEDEEGEFYNARLARITDKGAVIDFNHPLAGHTLVFEVRVLGITDGAPLH